jgi:hypothetical protein
VRMRRTAGSITGVRARACAHCKVLFSGHAAVDATNTALGVGARLSTRVGHAGIGAEGWDHYQEATLYPTAWMVPVQVVELYIQHILKRLFRFNLILRVRTLTLRRKPNLSYCAVTLRRPYLAVV